MLAVTAYVFSRLLTSVYQPRGVVGQALMYIVLYLPSFVVFYNQDAGVSEAAGICLGFALAMMDDNNPKQALAQIAICVLSAVAFADAIPGLTLLGAYLLMSISTTLCLLEVDYQLASACFMVVSGLAAGYIAAFSTLTLVALMDGVIWGAVFAEFFFPLITEPRGTNAHSKSD